MRLTTIPQLYRHANRWGQILAVLSKYGLAGWIERLGPRFTHGILKDRDGAALCSHSRETRIRLALSELGPTFIKLGQILSTRPDVVGVELAEELSKLQDDTPADPFHTVSATIQSELGQPLEQLFTDFEEIPLASASIGQVHRARLKNGDWVVVKVRHAGIEEIIRRDLDILTGLAHWAERVPELANYRPRATMAEFQRVLRRELDFRRELRNLQQFAHLFAHDTTIKIPRSYAKLSTARVLTMQYLEGIKLSHTEKLEELGFDLKEIARRGADLYLTMIFTHGFYHADPHPGNLIILPGNVVGLLDFGMVGRIDNYLREEVENLVLAIGEGDPARVTQVITHLGEVPPDLDQASLSNDVADFVAHYGNLSIEEINLSAALNEMTEIIRRYRIMLPARLAMLIKLLVMLEGTARLASPRFSLMDVLAPTNSKWPGAAFHRFVACEKCAAFTASWNILPKSCRAKSSTSSICFMLAKSTSTSITAASSPPSTASFSACSPAPSSSAPLCYSAAKSRLSWAASPCSAPPVASSPSALACACLRHQQIRPSRPP